MRVFIGPDEVAGWYHNLSKGMAENGIKCDFVSWYDHKFAYGYDKRPIILRLAAYFQLFSKFKLSWKVLCFYLPFKYCFKTISSLLRGLYLFEALFKYDAFIFTGGNSLWRWNLDLYILRFFEKKIVVNLAQGSDMRLPYASGGFHQNKMDAKEFLFQLENKLNQILQKVRRIEKHSIRCIGAPLSSSALASKTMINFFYLGIPCDLAKLKKNAEYQSTVTENQKFRILHAPSNPKFKGTDKIRKAIKELHSEGIDFEYVEIINKPNNIVLKEIQKCDLVVDELYSDTPMATFAAEAACFGKPALVGGYGFNDLKKWVSPKYWPPSVLCNPSDLKSSLKKLILNPSICREVGAKAKIFIEKNWSLKNVAKNYLNILEEEIPDEWHFNPFEVFYLHGCGIQEKELKRRLRLIIDKKGVSFLKLQHNPSLEKAYLSLLQPNT